MTKSETRHMQWEIADSLCAYLQKRTVLVGRAREIVQLCHMRSDGNTVAKFLQRAESMPHSPFRIQRLVGHGSTHNGHVYRITLK
jgi:hypothetical protein